MRIVKVYKFEIYCDHAATIRLFFASYYIEAWNFHACFINIIEGSLYEIQEISYGSYGSLYGFKCIGTATDGSFTLGSL